MQTLAYAGFSKGGEAGKFENNEDETKKVSTQKKFVFLPKIK